MSLIEEGHVYSYSQLTTFCECPYSFYVQKIEKQKTVGNAFSSLGSLVHSLIDEWATGLIPAENLPAEYERRYKEAVPEAWPKMLESKGYSQKAYNTCLDYFINFDQFKGYKIISTETKYKSEINGHPFVGVIDMILEDENNGQLIVLDHKSKSMKEFKKNEEEMYRQQYLYSQFIHEEFGKWPDMLGFNLFKENGYKTFKPFSKDRFVEVYTWAADTIEKIENADLFDFFKTIDSKSNFYCTQICSCRKICPKGQGR